MNIKGNLINTNKPRDSIVVADSGMDGVVKMPNTTRPAYISNWLNKQRHARTVVNFIYGNEHRHGGYFIPKIKEIGKSAEHPYVREQRAPGRALTKDFFDSLSPNAQDKIYQSLANFVYDMNHCRPVLTLQQKLSMPNESGLDFDDVLKGVESYLDEKEIAQINNAYNFFESHPELTSSVVFFHGDMNENNIFYDVSTDTVSFLDFAEATYETIEYIFNHDLIKLPWLDTDKLLKIYQKLSINDNVRIKSHPAMIGLYDALRAFRWTGESMIANANAAKMYENILHENVKKVTNAYGAVVAMFRQNIQTL